MLRCYHGNILIFKKKRDVLLRFSMCVFYEDLSIIRCSFYPGNI
eukprot:12447.XXX_630609_630740_1 [CDS] Oithona nana genome sequencing.